MQFHSQGNLAEAERAYTSILAQDPDQFDALQWLGVLKLQQGNALAAQSLIARAVKVRPDALDALCNLTAALLALDRHSEAPPTVTPASLSVDPTDVEITLNRGIALFSLRRYQEALASYDKLLSPKPRHFKAQFNRANSLVALLRYEEALTAFD